jgi:hypothetical protein
MPLPKQTPNVKTPKLVAYLSAGFAFLFLFSLASLLVALILKVDPVMPPFNLFIMFSELMVWGGWLVFIFGIVFSNTYKKALILNKQPTRDAKVTLIANIVALIAVPTSFVIFMIFYFVNCSGSC